MGGHAPLCPLTMPVFYSFTPAMCNTICGMGIQNVLKVWKICRNKLNNYKLWAYDPKVLKIYQNKINNDKLWAYDPQCRPSVVYKVNFLEKKYALLKVN